MKILTLFLLIAPLMVMTGLNIHSPIIPSYGQIENNESISSELSDQFDTMQQNTRSIISGYSEYVGKGITFFYPEDWILAETQVSSSEAERFGISADIQRLNISEDESRSLIKIQFGPTPMATYDLPENTTQEEFQSQLDSIFPDYILTPVLPLSTSNYGSLTELGEPAYDKYTIDGHRAGSVFYTAIYNDLPVRFLFVATQIGSNSIGISYGSPATVFDQYLSIAENIIKSIRISE